MEINHPCTPYFGFIMFKGTLTWTLQRQEWSVGRPRTVSKHFFAIFRLILELQIPLERSTVSLALNKRIWVSVVKARPTPHACFQTESFTSALICTCTVDCRWGRSSCWVEWRFKSCAWWRNTKKGVVSDV